MLPGGKRIPFFRRQRGRFLRSMAPVGALAVAMLAAATAAMPAASADAGPAASAGRAAAPSPAATAPGVAPAEGWKVLRYGAEQFEVPASWPVYDLATHPRTCVLMDRHAVYEGLPGPDPACPAQALGVTASVQVQPLDSLARDQQGPHVEGATLGGQPALVSPASGVTHRLEAAFPEGGVLVTIAFGADRALAEEILRSFTPAGSATGPARAGPSGTSSSGATPGGSSPGGAATAPSTAATSSAATSSAATSTASTYQAAFASGTSLAPTQDIGPVTYTGKGFDPCQAPSESSMNAWKSSPYRAVGVYIGGANRACGDGPLSATWVKDEVTSGWSIWPMYVGLQAPCNSSLGFATMSWKTTTAASQGKTSAENAVSDAENFAMGKGTPIYFDMESYDNADSSCSKAVIAFTKAWSTELSQLGYVSGFYSSAATGVQDMVKIYGQSGTPEEIDFAEWNGQATTSTSYIPAGDWASHQRIHQYQGNVTQSWGGVRINIDQDYADARLVGSPPDPGSGLTPGAAQSSNGEELVAVTAPDGSVEVTVWTPSQGWTPTWDIGGRVIGGPAVASPGSGEFDVFARGTDNAVWERRDVNGSWSPWTSLGGTVTAKPGAAASGTSVYVVARGTDGAVWERQADTASPWVSMGGKLRSGTGPAAAYVTGGGGLTPVAVGTDSQVWGDQMGVWGDLEGDPVGDPGASSTASSHLEVFATFGDQALWHRWWNPTQGWTAWYSQWGRLTSGPAAAVYPGSGREDVFGLGADGRLWYKTSIDGSWGSWELAG